MEVVGSAGVVAATAADLAEEVGLLAVASLAGVDPEGDLQEGPVGSGVAAMARVQELVVACLEAALMVEGGILGVEGELEAWAVAEVAEGEVTRAVIPVMTAAAKAAEVAVVGPAAVGRREVGTAAGNTVLGEVRRECWTVCMVERREMVKPVVRGSQEAEQAAVNREVVGREEVVMEAADKAAVETAVVEAGTVERKAAV